MHHEGSLNIVLDPGRAAYDPMKHLPMINPLERRALSLKFAIETKGVAFSLKNDASVEEAAEQVLTAAKMYNDFIVGVTDD